MNILTKHSELESVTQSFCKQILEHDLIKDLLGAVDTFFADDEARLQYQDIQSKGEELSNKQQANVELSESEIKEFETAREELLKNNKVTEFMEAQKTLQEVQGTVSKYIGLSLELGKVASEDDLTESNGGCCGGGCGC